MNDLVKSEIGKVRIFACGGCGTNVGGLLEKHRSQNEVGFGEIDIVYIDTSKSNLKSHIDKSNSYIIDGLDGSGKVRSENHEEINNRVRNILQQFKPTDLNIVISSGAGGSGSVIGPLLTRELLDTESPTIVLCIGSADTRLDAENTLKTIKSYEAIAKRVEAPVVMAYVQNSQTTSRSEADAIMFNTIISLAVLFSRQNHELDSKDLLHWLRFNKVTTFPVQLASLTVLDNKTPLDSLGAVISVATLAQEGSSTTLLEIPEYQCVGFLPEQIADPVLNKSPLNFVISDGIIGEAVKHLQKVISALESAQAARIRKSGILSDNDRPNDSGIIL